MLRASCSNGCTVPCKKSFHDNFSCQAEQLPTAMLRMLRFYQMLHFHRLFEMPRIRSRFALTRGASSSSDRRPTTSDQHLRPSLDFLWFLDILASGERKMEHLNLRDPHIWKWFRHAPHKHKSFGNRASAVCLCCWIDDLFVFLFCLVRLWYSRWPGKDTSDLWCFALPTRLIQMICQGWIRTNTKHAPCLEPVATSSHAWDMLAHCLQEFGLFLLYTPLVPIGLRHLQSRNTCFLLPLS